MAALRDEGCTRQRRTVDCDRLGVAAMLHCFVHVVPAAVVECLAPEPPAPVVVYVGPVLVV